MFKRKKKINTLFVSYITDANQVGNAIIGNLNKSTIDDYSDIEALQNRICKEYKYTKVIITNWKIIN